MAILGVWTVAALISASQAYVRGRGEVGWVEALVGRLPAWWIWALLTPLCLGLARRFPIDRENWAVRAPLHLLTGTIVVVAYIALQSPFAVLLEDRALTWGAYRGAVAGGIAFQYLTQLLTYGAIVAIGQALDAHHRLLDRERHAARLESELTTARLQSLRAQLQPHFLFNTLHTVGGFVRSGDRDAALGMLSGLSRLLRHTLDHLDAPEIALHEELEAAERYIEIEEVRFGDRLEIVRDFEPDTMDALVPALLLQPLLENAMKHGIQAEQDSGHVVIRSRQTGEGRLVLSVEDDGAGLPDGFDLPGHAGVGLGLTLRRLQGLYGDLSTLRVLPAEPRGTRVEVEIPLVFGA